MVTKINAFTLVSSIEKKTPPPPPDNQMVYLPLIKKIKSRERSSTPTLPGTAT